MAVRTRSSSVERQEAAALDEEQQMSPDQDLLQGTTKDSEDATPQDWAVADAARPDLDDETADGLSEIEEQVRHAAEDLPADEPREWRVRRKAHELWVSEGGPHGRAEDHWRIASRLVAEEDARRSDLFPYGDDLDRPLEEAATLANLGEFPGLADQGDDDS
jgi:hypothetical protein